MLRPSDPPILLRSTILPSRPRVMFMPRQLPRAFVRAYRVLRGRPAPPSRGAALAVAVDEVLRFSSLRSLAGAARAIILWCITLYRTVRG